MAGSMKLGKGDVGYPWDRGERGLITMREACALLGVSLAWFKGHTRNRSRNKPPGIRFRRSLRFDPLDVVYWYDGQVKKYKV